MAKTRVANEVFLKAVVESACCADAAKQLGLNEMSVYQRYNKLRKQYPNLPARPVRPKASTEDLAEFINSLLPVASETTEDETEAPEGWDRIEGGEETSE